MYNEINEVKRSRYGVVKTSIKRSWLFPEILVQEHVFQLFSSRMRMARWDRFRSAGRCSRWHRGPWEEAAKVARAGDLTRDVAKLPLFFFILLHIWRGRKDIHSIIP